MKTLGFHRYQEIRARITRRMELWERGLHAGLVGDAKEEHKAVARSYHDTVLSGKLPQDVHQATDREGGGCLFPDDQCTKTGRLVAEVLREKHPDMRVPPM